MLQKSLHLLVVDDVEKIREGITLILEMQTTYAFRVDYATTGKEAITKVSESIYDLVLMDITMPEMNGIEALKILMKRYKCPPIVMLSLHNEVSYIKKSYLNGATGYLLKTATIEDYLAVFKIVLSGGKYFSNDVSTILFNDLLINTNNQQLFLKNEILSKREVQVVSYLVRGCTNATIAFELNISVRTVEGHRYVIMKKLGFSNISELIKYGIENGF